MRGKEKPYPRLNRDAFKSNLRPVLPHVNRVIVPGRAPAAAECNLYASHLKQNWQAYIVATDDNDNTTVVVNQLELNFLLW